MQLPESPLINLMVRLAALGLFVALLIPLCIAIFAPRAASTDNSCPQCRITCGREHLRVRSCVPVNAGYTSNPCICGEPE